MSIPQDRVDDTAALMNALERAVDNTLVMYGQLYGELVKAQNEGELHPMLMHRDIFSRLPAIGAALTEARTAAVEVHRGMNTVAQKLNLTRSDYLGPPWDKTWPTGSAPAAAPALESASA